MAATMSRRQKSTALDGPADLARALKGAARG